MDPGPALLALVASVVVGLVASARLARASRRAWTAAPRTDGTAYRPTVHESLPRVPLVVRVAIALCIATAVLSAARVINSVYDVMNLADEPHIRLGLVPRSPVATVLATVLAFVAAATAYRVVDAARGLARRERARVAPAVTLLVVSLLTSLAMLHAITRVPIVLYWQQRMVVYLAVHALASLITASALLAARRRCDR